MAQMVILLVWSRAGMMVGAFFRCRRANCPTWWSFSPSVRPAGSVFAALTFAVAAFSPADDRRPRGGHDHRLHLQRARRAAQQGGGRAVGLLLAILTAVGFASAFLGSALIMPTAGIRHLACLPRDARCDDWPEQPL